jgi:hypothetical protein
MESTDLSLISESVDPASAEYQAQRIIKDMANHLHYWSNAERGKEGKIPAKIKKAAIKTALFCPVINYAALRRRALAGHSQGKAPSRVPPAPKGPVFFKPFALPAFAFFSSAD